MTTKIILYLNSTKQR